MLFEQSDYRSYLKSTLAERALTRAGYSIRGFAEKIGVSNSFLSEVLSQKKGLSVELAFKVAVKLDLTDAETQYFCLLVQLTHEKDPAFRAEISRRLNGLNPSRQTYDLSADLFQAIADWHHFAILELTQLTGFVLTGANAAKKLGIPKVEADLAIERLKRLELLEPNGKGGFRKAHDFVFSTSPAHNGAFKQFHRQVLEKAGAALDSQTPKERVSATDMIPLDSRHVAEVDRLSQEFAAAVMKLSGKSKSRDHVYALSVHFHRLTQKET